MKTPRSTFLFVCGALLVACTFAILLRLGGSRFWGGSQVGGTRFESAVSSIAEHPFLGGGVESQEVVSGFQLQVLHPETGFPISGAVVRAVPSMSSDAELVKANAELYDRSTFLSASFATRRVYRTDESGFVRVPYDPINTGLDIRAVDESGPLHYFGRIEFANFAVKPQDTVVLRRLRMVDVWVTNGQGVPVPFAPVWSFIRTWTRSGYGDFELARFTADTNGHIKVPASLDAKGRGMGTFFPTGEFMVGLDIGTQIAVEARPEFDSNGSSTVHFRYPETGGLHVNVIDREGNPIRNGRLDVKDQETRKLLGQVRFGGAPQSGQEKEGVGLAHLELHRILAVSFSLPGEDESTNVVVVGPTIVGEVVIVNLTHKLAVTHLHGVALDRRGAPITNSVIRLRSERNYLAITDGNGHFDFRISMPISSPIELIYRFGSGADATEFASLVEEQERPNPDGGFNLGVLRFVHPPMILSGRLLGPNDRPLIGSIIARPISKGMGPGVYGSRASEVYAVSNEAGYFEIFGDEESELLEIGAQSYGMVQQEAVSAEPWTKGVDLKLVPAAALSLQLDSLPTWAEITLDETQMFGINTEGSFIVTVRPLGKQAEASDTFFSDGFVSRETTIGPISPGPSVVEIYASLESEDESASLWRREIELALGINDLGSLDDALDMHYYEVEFASVEDQPVEMPAFMRVVASDSDGESRGVGVGARTGKTTWSFASVGPATHVESYVGFSLNFSGGLKGSWPLAGMSTRVFL